MNFTLYMPARVVSGPGAVLNNGPLIRELGTRALVVTGAHSAKQSGALDDYKTILEQQGMTYRIYDGIGPNPLIGACREAAVLAREMDAQMVIGLGGGSPLDAAKAVAVLAANPEISSHTLLEKKWVNPPLPVVATGTTSGTGSEVSSTSVLTWEDGRKRAVSHPDLYASLVLADPRYTITMSRSVTISTALDAFSHAAEGFLSPRCTDVPDWFARKALPLLWEGLGRLLDGKEIENGLRESLFYGSLWAGMVLNAVGTAFPHPFGYCLTEDYGIPHGRACAAFLPGLLEHAQANAPKRTEDLLAVLGCSLEESQARLGMMSETAGVRMSPETIDRYATRWEGLHNFHNVPGGYTVEEGKRLFLRLFGTKA